MKLDTGECHKISLLRSAVRQQAITWANVDPDLCRHMVSLGHNQSWGEYYSGTRLAQNDKHEYTKNIAYEYYLSTDFPVLVLVCSVLAPALATMSY